MAGGYFPELTSAQQRDTLRRTGRELEGDGFSQDDLICRAACGCIYTGLADDADGVLYLCPLHAAAPALLEAAKAAAVFFVYMDTPTAVQLRAAIVQAELKERDA